MAKAKPVLAADVIVCPYCGYEETCLEKHAALDLVSSEDKIHVNCEVCSKPFTALLKVTVTFATFPEEDK